MINKKLILTLSMAIALPTLALEPRPAPNPNVGLDGAATMHSDTYSSDTTPLLGPLGADSHRVKFSSGMSDQFNPLRWPSFSIVYQYVWSKSCGAYS